MFEPMMKKDAKMSKLSLACYLAVSLAVSWYAPNAAAIKVERDPSVSAKPELPSKAQPAPAVAPAPDLPKLTAAQIADKNVAARGGLAAWRAVQSIKMTGLMDVGGKANTQLPFTLQMKRPNKQRLAIEFAGQTSVQVFDGTSGWKLRPFLNRPDPEPFSADELSKTADGPGLDGPLIDYAAKGSKIELEGTETVEDKATYRLKLTTKQGHASHIWIDGTTFLEAKIEGNPRRLDGKMHPVETYLRDYRSVEGLMIPYISETRVQGVRASRRMTVENVALNLSLADALFAKPAPAAVAMGPAAALRPPAPAPVAAEPKATKTK
jgi:outer membrane lipoprotein-sorting protein